MTDTQRLRIVLVVGAVVRVAYWLTKWNRPLLLNDSWYYSGQAHQLAHGTWFRELFVDRPGAEHGPLTAVLMAPVSFGSHFVDWQRLVTVVTGILLVWVIARVAREVGGDRVALVAAGIAAIYPNLWMNDGLVMSESISTLMVALALWAAWRAVGAQDRRSTVRSVVLLGVALGLGVLARSELALLVPLLLAWVVFVRVRSSLPWKPVVVALVTAGLVVAPWVAFNLSRFERPVLLTTNDGTTLLGANCPGAYVGHNIGGWSLDCVVNDPLYRQDEEPSVRDARQRRLGLAYARGHLRRLPKVVAARLGRSLDLYGFGDLVHQDVGEERPEWAVWAGIVMFWALALLSVRGALLLARRQRSLLLVPMLVALATTVLFYGAHRMRSSAEPSLVILAAVALAGWRPGQPGRSSVSTNAATTSSTTTTIAGRSSCS